MATPMWFVELIKKHYRLRFFGANMANWPIIGKIMESILHNDQRGGDKIYYLPKERVVINQSIDNQVSMVVPTQVVEHFIKIASNIFLMHKCLCRDANDCKTYCHDIGCIFLGDGVKNINQALGVPVDVETALNHLKRARDAGLVHMIGRDKMDAVWMGVRSYDKLMTICNCCSCCCLYGILPHFSPKLAKKVERMPGVQVEIGKDCTGCGECTQGVCFVDAIHMVDGFAVINDECRGCGNCVEVCCVGAIQLEINQEDYIDIVISRLEERVDVV